MSLKRSSRALRMVAQPNKKAFSGEELTAVYLKQRRSVLERALHEQSRSFSRHEELAKPEAYVMENNDKLTIQCRFCGNHMAMATLPPSFQLFPPSEGGEAKSVESRDAAVQVNISPEPLFLLNAGDGGHSAAGASAGPGLDGYLWPGSPTAQYPSPESPMDQYPSQGYAMAGYSIGGRPTARGPPAFLTDPSVAFRSSAYNWNSLAGTSAGTQVTQWGSSSLHESVTNELQESKPPPAAAVRSASPIFISSASSSASSSPSSSPYPHHSGLNSSTKATSSMFPPAPAPHRLHPIPPRQKSSPTPESSPSLSLLPPSPFLASPPPNLRIRCLNQEEEVDLTPPPGLIAPLSPRLAEEEENEEESRETAPSPGLTKARPHQCSVCHKDMMTKQRLVVHFRVHTGERPYKCELCSAAYAQSGNLQAHMKSKHPLAIYKSINTRRYRKTSQNVAPATVVTASPPAAEEGNASVGFEPAGKSLTEQALDVAAADSKLAVPRNVVIRGANRTNTAKASLDFKEASDAPADFKQAGCGSIDVDGIVSIRETNVANIANDMEVNPIMDVNHKEEPNDITEATEQNYVKEVVNDIKEVVNDIKEVANDVKGVANDVKEVANDVKEVANDVEEVANDIKEEANDVKEVANDVKEVANDVKEVANDVKEVANDVKEVANDVEEVANDIKEEANDVKEVANDVKEVANDVKEVANDVKEVANDVKEVANDVKEVANGVKEVANDVKKVANDVEEVANDIKEEANDVKEVANDVKELDDINTVVDSTILVETRRCLRNNLEQGKDFFCLECLECFPTEEHLMKHEEEKHPLGDQQEGDNDVNRNPEQFVHLLRWKSEEDLLALSPDSEPMSAAEDQTTLLTAKQSKASSPEVLVKRAEGKHKARSPRNKKPKREAPTPASGEAPLRSRPRRVPEHAENYWTRVRMKAVASASGSSSHRMTRRNSTSKPMRKTDSPRRRTKPTSRHTNTPARQTDTPERQTYTPERQTESPKRQTDTPDKQAEKLAKQMCSLTDKQGRPTNTLVGEAGVLQPVQGSETNNKHLAGLEASGEEGHAGPDRRETDPMSEALKRVCMLDGNILSFLKPCSVRLVRLHLPTL